MAPTKPADHQAAFYAKRAAYLAAGHGISSLRVSSLPISYISDQQLCLPSSYNSKKVGLFVVSHYTYMSGLLLTLYP
jgi:hypothetical protein